MENCELGCEHYTCGSIMHLKECANYPDSLAELFDNLKEKNKQLQKALWESFYNEACLNRAIHSKAKEYADTRIKAYK